MLFMKKVVEYLPLLSICLIYFGFCNLHAYYQEFKVDIYVYITTPEIIMAFFPTIVFVSSIVGTSFIQEFLGKPTFFVGPLQNNDPIESHSKVKKIMIEISKSFLTWMIIMIGINFGVRLVLKKYFDYQPYDFQQLNIVCAVLLLIGLMCFLIYTGRRNMVRENAGVFSIFIVCYIGLQISSFRRLDAEKVKAGLAQRELSFLYHSKRVSTGKYVLYIGQTTGHLFLYDMKAASTVVFKTSEIDSLVIKN